MAWELKKRHNIVQKSNFGEAGLFDVYIVEEWINHTLPTLLHDNSMDNIINADETALFFKSLPEKSLQYSNINNDSIKLAKKDYNFFFVVTGVVQKNSNL